MKNLKTCFIILIEVYLLTFLTGCNNTNDNGLLKDKAKSEIEYLSANFIDILNSLNNITFEKFDVVAENPNLSEEIESKQKETTSQSTGGEQQSENQISGNNKKENQNQNENKESQSNGNSNIVTTQMAPNTILNPTKTEIDWTSIKTDIENLHETWNIIILDLYKLNVNNENIRSFSNDLDKATTYIKNEDKSNSILSIAKLYSYLPTYIENISTDNATKNIFLIKNYIINSYSILDKRKLERYY